MTTFTSCMDQLDSSSVIEKAAAEADIVIRKLLIRRSHACAAGRYTDTGELDTADSADDVPLCHRHREGSRGGSYG